MPRHKLIDYLNNPMLLKDISTEEMKLWAKNVPYAGLVQKLLAQKLIIEKAGQKEIDAAKAMSILSNANPKFALRSIEDFKRMILEDTSDVSDQAKSDVIPPVIFAHSVSDEVEASADSVLGMSGEKLQDLLESEAELAQDMVKEEEVQEKEVKEEVMMNEPEEQKEADTEEIRGSFTSWLSTLSAIHIEEKVYDVNIELDNDALVSDTLAKLLVQQGHYDEAKEMYEKLILKYPQKSSFFAAQIAKLKEL